MSDQVLDGGRRAVESLQRGATLRVMPRVWQCVMLCALSGLTGCDQLGIESPQKTAERKEADAKAVGSACRHALRAIEDCYTLNPKAEKAAVFAGWREMDEYMRENKLEGVSPVVPRPVPGASKPKAKNADDEEEDAEPDAKAGKSAEKPGKAADKAKPAAGH